MKKKTPCAVYSFNQTYDAFAFEAFAKENQIPGRLIPVPRTISAGCGYAFRIAETDFAKHEKTIAASGLSYELITHMEL